MLNAEKYRDEIMNSRNCKFGFSNRIVKCENEECASCLFSNINNEDDNGYACHVRKVRWLLSEYKEPVKLSRLEYEILKWAKKEGYKYIARTSSNSVFVHANKPNKLNYCWVSEDGNDEYLGMFNKFFQFVKWEDSEPTSIEYVLKNCEVVDNA